MLLCLQQYDTPHSLLLPLQGTVKDTAGKINLPVSSLSFTRVAYPLLKSTSFGIELSPGQQTLT